MRTTIHVLLGAMLVLLLAPPRALAQTDDRLVSTIKILLLTTPSIDGTRIAVHANDGTVYLYGSVDSQDDKRRAEEIARNVQGVTDVKNELAIRSGADSLQGAAEDDLRAPEPAQGQGLSSGAEAAAESDTRPGTAALPRVANVPPQVASNAAPQSECIGAAYRSRLLGEPLVTMRIRVPDDELRGRLTRALINDPLLESSQIKVGSVHDGAVRLEGHARTIPVHQHAIETALAVDGVCQVATGVTTDTDASAAAQGAAAPR